jgi:hypothetical protein
MQLFNLGLELVVGYRLSWKVFVWSAKSIVEVEVVDSIVDTYIFYHPCSSIPEVTSMQHVAKRTSYKDHRSSRAMICVNKPDPHFVIGQSVRGNAFEFALVLLFKTVNEILGKIIDHMVFVHL